MEGCATMEKGDLCLLSQASLHRLGFPSQKPHPSLLNRCPRFWFWRLCLPRPNAPFTNPNHLQLQPQRPYSTSVALLQLALNGNGRAIQSLSTGVAFDGEVIPSSSDRVGRQVITVIEMTMT